jgi:hypothetical protein
MMRIGIDFDNTIVSYDALFHKVAIEKGVIPTGLRQTKLAVREYLRGSGQEDVWTEMQGHVYGVRMDEAAAYPGAIEFLKWAARQEASVFIISHKTRYPFMGPRYDLHGAARLWVDQHLKDDNRALVRAEDVYFELTKDEKLARIRATACNYYVDDLPEILLAPDFPMDTQRILFDPEAHHEESRPLRPMRSWEDILSYFQQECRSIR